MKQILSFLVLSIVLLSCGSGSGNGEANNTDSTSSQPLEFYGNTQGTTFAVICNDNISITLEEINAILSDFDLALSGYIPNSVLTQLNESPAGEFGYKDPDQYFNRCYKMSQEVYALTNGAFDPTVFPLVDGWGFMKDVEVVPDSATVDSLRTLIGFQNGYHFTFKSKVTEVGDTVPANTIIKNTPQAKLDFNAIAQGLAVDVLAETLEGRGAKNYFVEIGGEIRVSGTNSEGETWRIGIDKPLENSTAEDRRVQEVIHLDNQSIATSGSYRKFYEKDGIKYSHTLDPSTGYPVTHSLLSATVIADNCAMADAMATAFMVMGADKAIAFLDAHPELKIEAYLIFINEHDQYETYYTPAFGKMIIL